MLGTSNGNNDSKGKIMNGWELARASVDGLVKAIESGRYEVFSTYLQTMARFHHYSAPNVLLIAAQRSTATHLEGVRSWNELGRFVRSGEKGIFIFAPMVGITEKTNNGSKAEEPAKKSAKGKKAAQPATSEPAPTQTETQLLGFRGVYVFDTEQTGGEDLPQSRVPVNISEKLALFLAFAKSQQMTIEHADWIAPNKATSYRGVIRLLPNMESAEEFTALLREIASQILFTSGAAPL